MDNNTAMVLITLIGVAGFVAMIFALGGFFTIEEDDDDV